MGVLKDSSIETMESGHLAWKAIRPYREIIAERILPYLPSPPPDVRTIKANMVRKVYSVPLVGEDRAILKTYIIRGRFEKVKYFLLPSRAATEWKTAFALRSRGIPTVEPIAWGERRKLRWLVETYLILKEIPGVQELRTLIESYLEKGQEGEGKMLRLMEVMGGFTAGIHRANVRHKDFHAGNVLVQPEKGNLFLIDLHTAKIVKFLTPFRKIENLARMAQGLYASLHCHYIKTYIQSYCTALGENNAEKLLRKVLSKVRKMEKRRIRSRSRRCLMESSCFSVHKTLRRNIYILRDYTAMDIPYLIAQHKEALSQRKDILKSFPHVTVTQVKTTIQGEEVWIVVKENRYQGVRNRVKNLFTLSRGRKAWFAGHSLLVQKFLTPKPLALVEEKSWGLIVRSYLITEYLKGVTDLDVYTYTNFCSQESREKRQKFTAALATTIRDIHEAGIYHSDLSGKNILVEEHENAWKFYFLDLESVHLGRYITKRRRVKSLTQVNDSLHHLSDPERVYFIAVYLSESGRHSLPEYFYRILRGTEKRRERREKLGYSQLPPGLEKNVD